MLFVVVAAAMMMRGGLFELCRQAREKVRLASSQLMLKSDLVSFRPMSISCLPASAMVRRKRSVFCDDRRESECAPRETACVQAKGMEGWRDRGREGGREDIEGRMGWAHVRITKGTA